MKQTPQNGLSQSYQIGENVETWNNQRQRQQSIFRFDLWRRREAKLANEWVVTTKYNYLNK